MGINAQNMALLEKRVFPRLPEDYTVYELGSQMVRANPDYPASEYYQTHGCAEYDCIDANGEGTINADLGLPLSLTQRDLVTDFGTSEHVFDVGQCWRNIHNLCKVGGIIVVEKIYDRRVDHGMYNLQPTFIHSLVYANRYDLICLNKTDTTGDLRFRAAFVKTKQDFQVPIQDRYRSMIGEI